MRAEKAAFYIRRRDARISADPSCHTCLVQYDIDQNIVNHAGRNLDEHVGYVFRTRDLESAEHFVDAMNVVVTNYNKSPEMGLDVPKPNADVVAESSGDENSVTSLYTELVKLDELRKRGTLTEEEFEAQKKKLLETN